jgi:hypothetical protein
VRVVLRQASPDEELRDAITGHRGPKSVGRYYGSKEMLSRWGIASDHEALSDLLRATYAPHKSLDQFATFIA